MLIRYIRLRKCDRKTERHTHTQIEEDRDIEYFLLSVAKDDIVVTLFLCEFTPIDPIEMESRQISVS